MLSITPLPGPFGVEIGGLDLPQPLAGETMREVPAATEPGDSRFLYRIPVKGYPQLA